MQWNISEFHFILTVALLLSISGITAVFFEKRNITQITIHRIQGGPAKVRPTYIFDGNICM